LVILALFFVFFTARGPVVREPAPGPSSDRTPVERSSPERPPR